MFQGGFENIIEEVIKDAISSQFILQFIKFGHDLFQKLDKESLTLFNTSFSIGLGFGNHFINGSLDLNKSELDDRFSNSHLGINNSLQFVEEVHDVCLHLTRFNLSLEFIENILEVMSNLHDIRNSHEFNIFARDKFSNEISQVLLDGRDQVFDGLAKSRFQDIIQQVIKNAESSDLVLQFSQFSHDLLQELNQKALSLLNSGINVSLSLGNHLLNGSINLLQSSFDNGLGKLNFGINNSLQFFEEVHDVSLHFTRFNLGLKLVENVLDVLSNLHNIRNGHVFSRLQLVSKISKMLTNGRDQVFNGMLQSGFENIIKEVIKDAISGQLILQFTKFGHDLLQKLNEQSLTFSNTSFSLGLSLGNQFIDGFIDLFKGSLDNSISFSNLAINNSLHFVKKVNNSSLDFSRFDLGLDFMKDILNLGNNIHKVLHSHEFNIFTRDKFSNEISQVLLDGRDQVFNGLAKSRLQDIIQQVIKDAESSEFILQVSQFGHDFLQKLNQKALPCSIP